MPPQLTRQSGNRDLPGHQPPPNTGIILLQFYWLTCGCSVLHPASTPATRSRGLQPLPGPLLTYSAICHGVRLQASSNLNNAFLTCIQDNVEGGAGVIALECCDVVTIAWFSSCRCGSDDGYWIFGWAIPRTCRCPWALRWTRRTLNPIDFWTSDSFQTNLYCQCA